MPMTTKKKMFVSNKDESARIFKSNLIEVFSKVHFSVPLIIYIPVIGYCLYRAVNMGLELGFIALAFACGLIVWTFAEYVIHRFVFHFHPTSKLGKRIHFIFHGIHHDYPNDSLRLVLPPSVSIPLALLFFYLYTLILPANWVFPFYSGFMLGYLCYDMMHYAIHHANIKSKWWNDVRTHHLKHHYQDDDSGFGVSSPLWDWIFRSNFKQKV